MKLIASLWSSILMNGKMGPNISSCITLSSGFTSVKTVGLM